MKHNFEKSLIKVNENSIFYKLKMFFTKFFKYTAEENTENDLTKEQIDLLCALYDKQILQ